MSSLIPERVKAFFESKVHVAWHGAQGMACCPFHDDNEPSLSLNYEDGVFYCHACEEQGGLVEFEQRTSGCDLQTAKGRVAVLWTGGNKHSSFNVVNKYPYKDENGKLLYEQLRLTPKSFRFRRPDGDDGWIYNLHGVRRILYRLREVIDADVVHIAEGEKDVETLRSWGLAATCNPGGAGKWREEFSKVLAGKTVIVWPDSDEPGQKHALAVATSVARHAASVKLMPPFSDGKDVTEWVENGGDEEELLQLVTDAPEFAKPAPGTHQDAAVLSPDDWRSEPLDGRWIIRLQEDFFSSYAVLPEGLAFVFSLWIIASRIFDLFDVFPYLCITSPTKRCGKTRVAELLELLCKTVISTVNISEAALFRTIEQQRPVIIMDEAETLANRKSERSQYLLALLQAGFKEGAVVPRCVGQNHDVQYFSVYCPKIVLGIGTLPDTLKDGSYDMRSEQPSTHCPVPVANNRPVFCAILIIGIESLGGNKPSGNRTERQRSRCQRRSGGYGLDVGAKTTLQASPPM